MAAPLPDTLRAVRDNRANAAVFLDYDGTLAPIVDDPGRAMPLPEVSPVLEELGRLYAYVAVISGRPVRFLADALGPPPGVVLFGLYGLEQLRSGEATTVLERARAWQSTVDSALEIARRDAPPGARIESKGLSLTLHWREHPAVEASCRACAQMIAQRTGLVEQPGRMAVELRPPLDVDKGTVVARAARGYRAVCYFGDDLGDLPAFAALEELARGGTVVARVAVVDSEVPAALVEAADAVVKGPVEALAVLEAMVEEPASSSVPERSA